MAYSSEALKNGIVPGKDPGRMTDEEKSEFLSSLEPDDMGFDGREGMEMEEDVLCP